MNASPRAPVEIKKRDKKAEPLSDSFVAFDMGIMHEASSFVKHYFFGLLHRETEKPMAILICPVPPTNNAFMQKTSFFPGF
ncbi:MAG: hypothetical protein IJT34_03120 [Butyrivibrio sp.]|nr:hypothetical protein [Butyrivibrio sp.]